MFRIVIAFVLFVHGVGHILGPLRMANMTTVNPTWQGDSWLLSNIGTTANQLFGVIVWIAALIGFAAAAAVVVGWLPVGWFAPLAVGSAIVSLLGFALFPQAFPISSLVSASILDLFVLAAVALLHWSPSALA